MKSEYQKQVKERDGVLQHLVRLKCGGCPKKSIFKFDVNIHLLREELKDRGWTRGEQAIKKKEGWLCPECGQVKEDPRKADNFMTGEASESIMDETILTAKQLRSINS